MSQFNHFENCIQLSIKLGEQTLLMAVFDTLDLKKEIHSQASQEKSKQQNSCLPQILQQNSAVC